MAFVIEIYFYNLLFFCKTQGALEMIAVGGKKFLILDVRC